MKGGEEQFEGPFADWSGSRGMESWQTKNRCCGLLKQVLGLRLRTWQNLNGFSMSRRIFNEQTVMSRGQIVNSTVEEAGSIDPVGGGEDTREMVSLARLF